MRPRFLGTKIDKEVVSLHRDEVHHATRVLRIKTKDRICVFDQEGREWLAEVFQISDKRVLAKILEEIDRQTEPRVKITAIVSPPKGQRWDFLLEKLTEIGISEIVPLITSRTVRIIRDRRERWQRVILSAVKQSGRTKIPKVFPPMRLEEVLEDYEKFEKRYIALPDAPHYREIFKHVSIYHTACYLIGPEGGFSKEEIASTLEAGFEPVSLGPRILRVETAAIFFGIVLLEYSLRFSE